MHAGSTPGKETVDLIIMSYTMNIFLLIIFFFASAAQPFGVFLYYSHRFYIINHFDFNEYRISYVFKYKSITEKYFKVSRKQI